MDKYSLYSNLTRAVVCYLHISTCQIFMRNNLGPDKYLKSGLSFLHSCVMASFVSVKKDYYECKMNNLYNSTAFCKAVYNHWRIVLCCGITRGDTREIPPSVQQTEVKNRNQHIYVCKTVNAKVLHGDDGCLSWITLSIYNTK